MPQPNWEWMKEWPGDFLKGKSSVAKEIEEHVNGPAPRYEPSDQEDDGYAD